MRCNSCGQETDASAQFCGRCGAPLGRASAASTERLGLNGQQGLRYAIVAAGTALLVVVGVVLGAKLVKGSSPAISAASSTSLSTVTSPPEATVPPTMEPAQLLALAVPSWSSLTDSLADGIKSTSAELVDGEPTGATIDSTNGVITVWSNLDGQSWIEATTLQVDWGGGTMLSEFALADATGDDSAEIFVSYFPNRLVGQVYVHEDGEWRSGITAEGLELSLDGLLSGAENMCVPSCADGLYADYTVEWTGSRFVQQYYDSYGTAIDLFDTTSCVGDYRARDFEPLQKCDKGEAVKVLQLALKYFGFLTSSDGSSPAADGYFGKDTVTSVRLYQLSIGVPVTGVAEGDWYHQLVEAYNSSVYGFGD